MTHLIKQTNIIMIGGASVIRMACVNSPFIKGRIVDMEKFAQTPIESRCKKCQKIFEKRLLKNN